MSTSCYKSSSKSRTRCSSRSSISRNTRYTHLTIHQNNNRNKNNNTNINKNKNMMLNQKNRRDIQMNNQLGNRQPQPRNRPNKEKQSRWNMKITCLYNMKNRNRKSTSLRKTTSYQLCFLSTRNRIPKCIGQSQVARYNRYVSSNHQGSSVRTRSRLLLIV